MYIAYTAYVTCYRVVLKAMDIEREGVRGLEGGGGRQVESSIFNYHILNVPLPMQNRSKEDNKDKGRFALTICNM